VRERVPAEESWINELLGITAVALLLAGCSKPQPRREAPPAANIVVAPPPPATAVPPPAPLKVRATIDPKSNAAAEELVRGFVRLINSGRLNDAYMLLGPNAPPRTDFDRRLVGYKNLDATLGSAGDQEGAAGSIYVSVPLTISGELDGKRVDRSATAIVRRVNDVPGSTEAQRHWHIERIDWQ
jgi:hypothetical protein